MSSFAGGVMVVAEKGLLRLRMSWEEFLAYPSERAEWVDGEVVVSPPVGPGHALAATGLIVALKSALPDLFVMSEVGVRLPHNRLRGPDITVTDTRPEATWVETAPVLVVEILSPSTRTEDTVRKGPEYAEAGVGQFWVVDPDHRSIDVFTNAEGRWEPLLHLDQQHPTGSVQVGEHGVVSIDLAAVVPA